MTDEDLDRLIAGKATLTRLGKPVPFRLGSGERIAYAQAKERGYLVCGRGRREALVNAWFHYCEIHAQPYARIAGRSPQASRVTLDFITVPGFREELRSAWVTSTRQVLLAAARPGASVYIGVWTEVTRTRPEDAEALMRYLLARWAQLAGRSA